MAATALEETSITYEELAEIEQAFEDVETEIIRQQTKLTKPLYEKRQAVVSKIPNFWPLVLEQAPPDIDEFIQPTDSAILLTALTGLSVSRFEIENGNNGDPRSVAIRLEFSENEYFEDKVLEKKFWYRHDKDGDGSLVSEPVDIKWKAGKDQTNGLLGMVKAVWDEEVAAGKQWSPVKPSEYTAKQKALKEKIEKVGLGGMSFFAWFGYRGSRISAEASKAAKEKVAAEREAHKRGENMDQEMDDDDDEEEEDEMELEIFPEGDSLAVAISDDLWPGALRYFIQAQEVDALSDLDFETEEEDEDEEEGATPAKAHKHKKGGCCGGH